MTLKLFCKAIIRFILGAAITGLLLFAPAGTFNYPEAWLFMGILFIPMFIAGIFMIFISPDLLKKRLNAKEEQSEQKVVVAFSGIMFILSFVCAGLSFRFSWLCFPKWVSYAGTALFLISYALYAEVMRENQYLSRTVEVQDGQKVVDTGLYGIVRHPMYSVTVVLFLSMPLILRSVVSLGFMLFYPVILIKRILNEEKVLEEGLAGYKEYKTKVKYRLIPFIW